MLTFNGHLIFPPPSDLELIYCWASQLDLHSSARLLGPSLSVSLIHKVGSSITAGNQIETNSFSVVYSIAL